MVFCTLRPIQINTASVWRSDGTTGGTVLLADLAPGTAIVVSAGSDQLQRFLALPRIALPPDANSGSRMDRISGLPGRRSFAWQWRFVSWPTDSSGSTLYFVANDGTSVQNSGEQMEPRSEHRRFWISILALAVPGLPNLPFPEVACISQRMTVFMELNSGHQMELRLVHQC